MVWRNWAGLQSCAPSRVVLPSSVPQVSAAVSAATAEGLRVKAVGSGHSFNDIAVARDVQLDLRLLRGVVRADTATGLVTVAAGTPLHELTPRLWDLGLSLANLGDIDRQTLAGAVSTGTHGTGTTTAGSLSAQVRGLELVLADGSVTTVSAGADPFGADPFEADLFEAARVGLGAFGVLTAVTLQCVPAFHLRSAEEPLPLAEAVARLVSAEQDSPEFFWFPHTSTVLFKTNTVVDAAAGRPLPRWKAFVDDELVSNGVLGMLSATTARLPRTVRAVNGVAPRFFGRRTYVDAAHTVLANSRRVRFREGEFAVPAPALPAVVEELQGWLARPGNEVGFPLEIRIGPAESPWLSTAFGRRTAWIAVQTHVRQEIGPYLAQMQRIVAPYGGRPHWGKLHTLSAAELAPLYPRFCDVLAVRDKVDPDRVFGNAYLERVLGP